MCGITGILRLDGAPVREGDVRAMTRCLAHRGPNGEGIEILGQVGIGHRRLSIIDLEGGRQPLANEDDRVWVTFNGEIYNYRELRRELERTGHRFRTHSDTEVIVHAYEQWGDDCVERFRGMFAFAVVDLRERRVFLARDHLGIKPLHYLRSGPYFAFASELQAFRHLPDLQLDLDLHAIDEYLYLQYVPAPRTVFRQVRKLLPAHRMSIGFDGRVAGPDEYWRLRFRPEHRRSEAEWLEALDAVLRDSVRAHLVADVPFGAFLSGGIDSTAVVGYMSELLDHPVRTFSIGFPEQEFSELRYAEMAARRYGTEHHTEVVSPDALAILPDLVRHYGEPFGDTSAIPTYHVARLARSEVPMVLSGDGGDEAFAGYETYRHWVRWITYDGHRPVWRHLPSTLLGKLLGRRDRKWLRALLEPLLDDVLPGRTPRRATLQNWLRHMTYIGADDRLSLWRPEHRGASGLAIEHLEREFGRTRRYSPYHQAQYADIKSYLSSDILVKVDIASMMHGLEVRTPLTDVRVYEFAATIPESHNVTTNGGGEAEGKQLLKKLVARHLPPQFVHRRKMGFGLPAPTWFAAEAAHRGEVADRLLGTDSMLFDLFDQQAIATLLRRESWAPMWLLLVLDEWLRQHSSRPSEVAVP